MDNPKVTSKFDRMGGHPRNAGHVSSPGGVARPPGGGVDGGHPGGTDGGHPTHGEAFHGEGSYGGRTHYHPNEHGRMHRGERADHPTYGSQHPTAPEDPHRGGESPASHDEGEGSEGYGGHQY